jgi:eukaryotic-like serine/threonine-protein kinase
VALASGTRLGAYEVVSLLGAGGMGEVYRARDTKLQRDVALKILPDAFTQDGERIARFRREAQVLASLNQPNIAAIYGFEDSSSTHALVLELVEGPTLADRIATGPLPLDEAFPIARQIAEALEAAHEQGIVHRDLKPANIKVRADGTVKVLDFGLAKALEPTPALGRAHTATPTMTSPAQMTGAGVILGTAAYMSPEQAKGRPAVKQSDVWAFGCVLYEMLTGTRAFDGENVSHALARVIERDPDWTLLPADTPPSIQRLLRRCLRKALTERLQAIGDARIEILDANDDVLHTAPPAAKGGRRDGRWSAKAVVTAVVLAATLGGLATWMALRASTPKPSASIAHVLIDVAPAERLLSGERRDASMNRGRPSRTSLVFSRDGESLVFSAERGGRVQLYLRRLDHSEASPIPGTERAVNPFLSPDGQSVGFYADGGLKRTPLSGGPVVDICKANLIFGATWTASDEILFALENGGLWRVPAGGGKPTAATMLDAAAGEVSHRLPQILPDGTTVVFTVTKDRVPSWDDTVIVAQSLATGQRKVLVEDGADARYVGTGHMVFLRRGTLMVVPFDARRLEVTGTPVGLVTDVMQSVKNMPVQIDSGAGQFAISDSGSLAYATGGVFPQNRWNLVWVDRTGQLENLPVPAGAYAAPQLSPDGRQIAYHTTSDDWDIWTYDVPRGIAARIALPGLQRVPIWTPDGSRLAVSSTTGRTRALFLINPDGTGSPELLMTPEGGADTTANAWTPDGKTLAAVVGSNLWFVSRNKSSEPHAGATSRSFAAVQADFSPDGRWLAYATASEGVGQVYVQPFPALDRRERISTKGGLAPLWSHDGRELFYLENESGDGPLKVRVMAVPISTSPTFTAGAPRQLFEGSYRISGPFRSWDVTRDGRRFLMVQETPQPAAHVSELMLVLNWSEELRRLAPVK